MGLVLAAQAQQSAQSSLFMLNPFQWNPAYAGLDYSLSATGGFRKQWVDLPGSPATQFLNAHLPLAIAGGGVGLKLENDAYGAERNAMAMVAYNYQMPVWQGVIGFGFGAGVAQRTLDGSKLRTPEGIYNGPVFDHSDGILPLTREQGVVNTFEAGVFYKSEWLEAGISARNLSAPSIRLNTLETTLSRSYIVTLGMHFDLNRLFTIHPSVLVRSDAIQTQTDAAVIVRYRDNIFAGSSLRGYNSNSLDAVAFIAGFKLNDHFTMGYAYDQTLSRLQDVSNGSHEIILTYNLNKAFGQGRLPRIIYNPRSL